MLSQAPREADARPEFTLTEGPDFQDWWIALMELGLGILFAHGIWTLVPALWAKLALAASVGYYTLLELSWKTWPRLVGMRFDFYLHDWVVLTDRFGRTRAAGPAKEVAVYIGGENAEYLCWRHSGRLEFFADLNEEQRTILRSLRYVPEHADVQRTKRRVIVLTTAMTFTLGIGSFYFLSLPTSPRKPGPSDEEILDAYSQKVEGTFTQRTPSGAPADMKVTRCFYGGNEACCRC